MSAQLQETNTLAEAITSTAHLFYQLKIEEATQRFASLPDLLEAWLKKQAASSDFVQDLHASLAECMQAFQLKEYILVADLLLYELLPKISE